jgi:hypothetical protein
LEFRAQAVNDHEFFCRYNGWATYDAVKLNTQAVENRIGSGANPGAFSPSINLGTTMLVVTRLTRDGAGYTRIDSWINPVRDDLASPDQTQTGLESTIFSGWELRMQNKPSRVDELLIATTWEEVVPEPVLEIDITIDAIEKLDAGRYRITFTSSAADTVHELWSSTDLAGFTYTGTTARTDAGGSGTLTVTGSGPRKFYQIWHP